MRFMKLFRPILVISLIIISIYVVYTKPINLGLDLQGGLYMTLEGQDTETVKVDNDAIQGAIEVIQNRINGLGLTEPVIRKKGYKQITVEIPGIKEVNRAKELIGQTALLEFKEAEWATSGVENLTKEKKEKLYGKNITVDTIYDYDNKGNVISERKIILKNTVLTGADLTKAVPGTSQYGEPFVSIEFNSEGTKKFRDATTRNVGKPIAIILDGKIISAPNVQESIAGGKAQITGKFSTSEMKDLVIKLKAGALPIPIDIIASKNIGPTLGKDSIEKSKIAFVIGILAIFIYLIFVYRLSGFLSCIALLSYIIFSLACLKFLNATLTLPGIAGFILTIGMAVDANVIIFERIKEERKNGLTLIASINAGFNQAYITILDANITTLIAAIVLFWLGTGTIKGFAVTLSIGILVSMFSAIVVTKLLILMVARLVTNKENLLFKV
ncbi:protein translocase subunit SecD [Candidatus Marinamargulisbacteria bacterium SCGC AG-410-N11]|nr:protein translocase subunit SecD [Candidatus Marinamargulisbacteria bacterium SCGC AG-410-N11]